MNLSWLRARPWTWAVGAGVLCGVVGYGTGRFASPSRETVIDESVIRWTAATQEQLTRTTTKGPMRKTARVVTETIPGGGRRTTTDYVLERGPILTVENRATASQSSGEQAERKETTKVWDAPRLTLGLKGGASVNTLAPTWGAFGHYRPWDIPINLGVDYTRKDNVVQGTVSATF
jgi:hypothetical protein